MKGSKIIDGCMVWGLLDPQTIQNKWIEWKKRRRWSVEATEDEKEWWWLIEEYRVVAY